MSNTSVNILDFQNIDKGGLAAVGGKGANLAELSRLDGVRIPEGFCVTTEVYRQIVDRNKILPLLLEELALLKADNRKEIGETSAKIRKQIEATLIPDSISAEIIRHIRQLGENDAYAVRSSATAEDLPTASFAGQQDTYLNIIGEEAILNHISKCWASLFTERAVIYRIQNGFDHRKVCLSVIIQKMVFADVAGIMFTADPVTSNRKVLSIEASFGLGEALVSGIVNVDHYKIRNGQITDKHIATKKQAVYALKGGGSQAQEIAPDQQNAESLTDEEIIELEQLGRKIEAHFGSPQDIEWCLVDGAFYVVQSRPITTLFPIPETDDQENHVYVSVGHQQMMTDAMKPLGLAFFLRVTPALMRTAGGRLFVDVAPMLATPSGRKNLIETLGKYDPLCKDAFSIIMEREDFIKLVPDDHSAKAPMMPPMSSQPPIENDPQIAADLIRSTQSSIAELKQQIRTKSGAELIDFILEDINLAKKILFDPQSTRLIMVAMNASSWINDKMEEWLGEKNAANPLSQSVPNNVTSEMGLALLDVADTIRPFAEVIAYLQQVKNDDFLKGLTPLAGGSQARAAIEAFLEKYGMRCAGEIDITRSRWAEKPATLIPIILGNIKNFLPGESERKFEQGRQQALQKEKELLARLGQLPDGEQKVAETKRMIDLIRNFAGYREYPKYGLVSRSFVYRQALLKEAERLTKANVIREAEDIYYLNFEELGEVVRSNKLDFGIIDQRKEDYKNFEKLSPPRVMTSDGEIITGSYKRENLPKGAIAGIGVCSGVIEGRARVVLNMEEADMEEGDILVTAFTDPSWTPLFVSIKGLVTEVGGLMTHGAVIAREYGLPAVVGLENATKLIKDGQRIRVNGTDGYVEVVEEI